MSEEPKAIEPNLCPGGMVVRVYVDKELMVERLLTNAEEAAVVGEMDMQQAMNQGKFTVEILSFDGDSGAARTITQMQRMRVQLNGVIRDVWAAGDTWMSPELYEAQRRQRLDG